MEKKQSERRAGRNRREKERMNERARGRGILRKESVLLKEKRQQWTYSVYPTVLVFANAVMTMRLSGETDVPCSKMSTLDREMVRAETQTHCSSLSRPYFLALS